MKLPLLLALLPAVLLSACALEATHHHDDGEALVKTQVLPEPLTACISQKLGVSTTPMDGGGFVVDTSGLRLSIIRDQFQTIVQGPEGVLIPTSVSEPVIQCTLMLTPTSHRN